MAIRLAITVSGAVSLGSYEAGVLYEILDAISQHNTSAPDENKIFVDALTGASAGGMSVTVLAQKLLFEAGALADPYNNVLYRAWVQDIGLQGLLSLQLGEDPTHSILSSNLVESLSKKYLCQRYSTHIPPTAVRHAASASEIRLGLALSNLNGVDYSHSIRPKGNFTYTRFQDRLCAKIDSSSDTLAFWEPLRNAAVSCGAFPFAFRVKELVRHQSEYDSPDVVFPLPFETFTYTDGGLFQNEPLGLAKNLVDGIDHHVDTESRFYLFIAPHARTSTAHADFNAASADFEATAVQLFNAVYGQAGFQDWVRADEVNTQVDVFNERAMELKNALEGGQVQAPPLEAAAQALLPLLFSAQPAEMETADLGRKRLRRQFQQEYNELTNAMNPQVAETWINSILTLEAAAGLGQRDEMVIYGITAKAEELAGAGLDAFLGFFDQSYRDHDYDIGRTKAQEFLQNSSGLLGTEGNLPTLDHYVPKAIHPIDAKLNGLKLADVPQDLRETVKGRLDNRASDLLKELNVFWMARPLVKKFFIGPRIRNLLGL